MAPVLEGKSVGWDQKNTVLKEELVIWRTKNQARDPGTHTPTQGFNLLHMSANWFLGNWTRGPSSKGSLMVFYCKTLSTPYVENHSQHD
jgi:hypothetical protein